MWLLRLTQVDDYAEFKAHSQHYSNPFVSLISPGQDVAAQQLAITDGTPSLAEDNTVTRRSLHSSQDREDDDFVVIATEPDASEDYLGLVRELLGMSDKSNIESMHECQRLEGQEPKGPHSYRQHCAACIATDIVHSRQTELC
jgi:hypothetical protein